MKLLLKDNSVNLDGISLEMIEAIHWVMLTCMHSGMEACVLTSARDGKHAPGSLHQVGQALDFRNRNWPDSIGMADSLRAKLGPDFDVVLEKDHLHIEFDPKP